MPQRYLLVWTGGDFPYVARLAADAVRIVDPCATVEIHLLGDAPRSTSHLADLTTGDEQIELHHIELARVFADHPRLAEVFEAIPAGAHSARSNLLRYALVHRRGGVYLDFDVLVRRPVHELGDGRAFVGVERVWRHDRPRLEGRYRASMIPGTVGWAVTWAIRRADSGWLGGRARTADRLRLLDPLWSELQPNNAVLGGPPGAEFTGLLLEAAETVDPTVRYALGPSLVADVARRHPTSVRLLPESVCYAVPPSESHRFFEDRTLELPADAALIHYVNSNHRRLLSTVGPQDPRVATRSEVFWRMCRDIELSRLVRTAPGDPASTARAAGGLA